MPKKGEKYISKSKNIGKIIKDFLILDNFNENGNTKYKVQCIYCKEVTIRNSCKFTSKNGHVKCDCQKKYRIRNCNRNTRLGRIHHSMLQRCENSNNQSYKYYGGRGISVCEEWQDYLNFENWALSNGYSDELSIDRIDVNGNYEPSNYRWTTNREQCNNKRDNHLITYDGITQTLEQWATEIGIKSNTLLYRLKRGWSVERALNKNN